MRGNTETEVVSLDASTLVVRYYDDGRPGKYRCWRIPAHEARDIARWWSESGAHLAPGRATAEQRIGNVLIRLLSSKQVYARGCDQFGRPVITG